MNRSESEEIFILNGRKMQSWSELMLEFEEVMRFPAYFGKNIAALDECLADLEWAPASSYRIVIRAAGAVLAEEAKVDQAYFFKLLNNISLEWANGSIPGTNWTRNETAFRVILEDSTAHLRSLQELMNSSTPL